MDAQAEKSAPAVERAEKKAARRAAFIQEVAEAVAIRFGQALPVGLIERRDTLHLGGSLALALGRYAHGMSALTAPALPKRSPFEQAMKDEEVAENRARHLEIAQQVQARKNREALNWAIEAGYLPASATELPSEEVQAYLLATGPAVFDADAQVPQTPA